jgi:protein O-GlcNAc transferase
MQNPQEARAPNQPHPVADAELAETLRRGEALTLSTPASALGWKVMGGAFLSLGQYANAIGALRTALELDPDDVQVCAQLGRAQRAMGQLDDECESWHRALQLDPDCAEYHCQLGRSLRELGHIEAARECFRNAVRIAPRYSDAQCRLGEVQLALGSFVESEIDFVAALEQLPDDFEMLLSLGSGLRKLGRRKRAEEVLAATIELCPHQATAKSNLAIELIEVGLSAAGENLLRQALELEPANAALLNNLGQALARRGALSNAADQYTQSLKLRPHHATTLRNLANVLFEMGRIDETIAKEREALALTPDCPSTRSAILFCLSRTTTSKAELIEAHFAYGASIESPLRKSWPSRTADRNPDRPLHIGFVSADFRNHSLAYFFEPIVWHLAQSPNLVLHAYSNNGIVDEVTKRLRPAFKQWRSVEGLSDLALAELIASDGIDILIDLSGHTAGNRLPVFARKPAPLQASWIGYPATTGLQAVDYYIADRHMIPEGMFEDQFTEKILRLPAIAPFLPHPDSPEVNALPALSVEQFTFASFNHSSKLNHSLTRNWARLLRALPESRLILCGIDSPECGVRLVEHMVAEGIAPGRLSLRARVGTADFLALHHEVDLCLDSFPYTGGTTTQHAMWMGVPTLTMIGETPASRVGMALLEQVGLRGFTGENWSEVIDAAKHWAERRKELGNIRFGLRQRMAQSVLGRPDLIASSLEQALRRAWHRWCAGLPAFSFEIGTTAPAAADVIAAAGPGEPVTSHSG